MITLITNDDNLVINTDLKVLFKHNTELFCLRIL